MGTNTFIIGVAEPFGLVDRRDIFGEIVLQEVRQNFFTRAIRCGVPRCRSFAFVVHRVVPLSPGAPSGNKIGGTVWYLAR
jgi:hypothetical protein